MSGRFSFFKQLLVMEKMVLLLWAMYPVGSYMQTLRLNGLSANKVRFYPESDFLQALLPSPATEKFQKTFANRTHLNLPDFISHVKNTSKIFFPPAFQPGALGG